MPGVSRIAPPPGTRCSSRVTVVWRPLPSARRPRVRIVAPPTRAFRRVDFPTPDAPSSATVAPAASRARIGSRPTPSRVATASTTAPGASTSAAAARAAASGTRSALVRTTMGSAPDAQARARSRSRRPGSGSGARPSTTATTSALAARAWPREDLSTCARTTLVRRGRTSRTAGSPSAETTTQSPATGADVGSLRCARRTAEPQVAVTVVGVGAPVSSATSRSHAAASARHTRPTVVGAPDGSVPGAPWRSARAVAQPASQPSRAR